MMMWKLAFSHFKQSFRKFFALILSLAFAILILLNFVNLFYTDAFDYMNEMNRERIDNVVQVISFVLICFIFFFLWYAVHVFLNAGKKEIGIYTFMGLTNQRIGRLYLIEFFLVGICALFLGLLFGTLTTQLFLMIILVLSGLDGMISFRFSVEPIAIASAVFLVIYVLFALSGYVNIVRSSVQDMLVAARKNESVRIGGMILMIRTVLGIAVLSYGYYFASKEGGMEVMGNIFLATVFVVIGTYLLFGGFIPFLFQNFGFHKRALYGKGRILWVNNVIFRMKRNYRTYAMVCVLMICAVTALASGFAMKLRCEAIRNFRNTYTFQILVEDASLEQNFTDRMQKECELDYLTSVPILQIDVSAFDFGHSYTYDTVYGVLPYSAVRKAALNAGLDFPYEELADNEIVDVSRIVLLSTLTKRSGIKIKILEESYVQIDETNEPYLGYLEEQMSFYIVSDDTYEHMKPYGNEFYSFNYCIADPSEYERVREALSEQKEAILKTNPYCYIGMVYLNPDADDNDWLQILYPLCFFMFLVFVTAGGSVLFMKLYHDAFEDRERYLVLNKLGIDTSKLYKSLQCELRTAFLCPIILMTVSSYFSVHTLEAMMNTSLKPVLAGSVGVVWGFFYLLYRTLLVSYRKNSGITGSADMRS